MTALLASLGVASQASALIITGGPVYTLPGGGNCTVSGIPSTGMAGATVSCSGVNLAAHTHVYFAIKNNSNVNGNTMTGVAPAAGTSDVFRYLSNTASAITYTSSTTINDFLNGVQPVNNQLVLTLTAGSATIKLRDGVKAGQLAQEADVRISGVTVGKVKTIVPDKHTGSSNATIELQTQYILDNITKTFEAAGSSLDHVVKAQVFLTDLNDFHGFDKVWKRYFKAPPPRTTIGCTGLLVKDTLV